MSKFTPKEHASHVTVALLRIKDDLSNAKAFSADESAESDDDPTELAGGVGLTSPDRYVSTDGWGRDGLKGDEACRKGRDNSWLGLSVSQLANWSDAPASRAMEVSSSTKLCRTPGGSDGRPASPHAPDEATDS